MVQLKRVETKADWEQFIDLPWRVYAGDVNWVPPLRIAVRDMLDVKKNPFFKHATMAPFLALKDGEVVGRIVGIIDDTHNQFHNERVAFFGFFECVDDREVSKQLLNEVAEWGAKNGMETVRGPVNLSTNHECGLLVDGFSDPPAVMMTYNPPYYVQLFEAWGLTKTKDLYAYDITLETQYSDRMRAHVEKLKASGRVTFRPINMADFDNEVAKIFEMYNENWESNWGFVPLSPDELKHFVKELKPLIDPQLILFAEVAGKVAGFGLTLPDVNQAIAKVRNGRLLPTGILKLLWHLKGPGRKKTIKRCRIWALGVKKEYRTFGLGPLLYAEYFKRCPEAGYQMGECSWILEDNGPMNAALEQMRAKRSKTYRIYDRPVASLS